MPPKLADPVGFKFIPWLRIGIGLMSLAALLFAILLHIRSPGWFGEVYIVLVGGALIALFFSAAGNLIFARSTSVQISFASRFVEITNRRIYGKSVRRYSFDQIIKFKSYRTRLNLTTKYFLAVVLSKRKTRKLNVPIGSDKNDTVRLIKSLNKSVKAVAKRLPETE